MNWIELRPNRVQDSRPDLIHLCIVLRWTFSSSAISFKVLVSFPSGQVVILLFRLLGFLLLTQRMSCIGNLAWERPTIFLFHNIIYYCLGIHRRATWKIKPWKNQKSLVHPQSAPLNFLLFSSCPLYHLPTFFGLPNTLKPFNRATTGHKKEADNRANPSHWRLISLNEEWLPHMENEPFFALMEFFYAKWSFLWCQNLRYTLSLLVWTLNSMS